RPDLGMAVAKDQRAPGPDVVDIGISIDIKEIRPVTARHEERLAADPPQRARGAIHPAGNDPARPGGGRMAAGKTVFRAGGYGDAVAHDASSLRLFSYESHRATSGAW